PLRWLGDRSYGIYLWHWPIVVLIVSASPGAPAGVPFWAGVLALVLTLVVSDLSYRFVEMPIRRRGLRASMRSFFRALSGSSARRSVAISIGAAATAVMFGTVASIVTAPGESSAAANIRAGEEALAKALATPAPTPTPMAVSLPAGDQV